MRRSRRRWGRHALVPDVVEFLDHLLPIEAAPRSRQRSGVRDRLRVVGDQGVGLGLAGKVARDLLAVLDPDDADQGLVCLDRQG